MSTLDRVDFADKYFLLRGVDQIHLMEALDEAILYLKDAAAQNVRLEHRLKDQNSAFGTREDAVEMVDYIHEELQGLEGYRAYVELWCDGEDPWEEKYYRHLIRRLQDGTDISSDVMGSGYTENNHLKEAGLLIIQMSLCAKDLKEGIKTNSDYAMLENRLIKVLRYFDTELSENRALIRKLILEKGDIEETAIRNAELLAAIKKEVMESDLPLSEKLSTLLDETPGNPDVDAFERLPW